MKKLKKSEAVTAAAICAAGMVILEYAPIALFPSEPLNTLAKTACSRCLGAVMFLVLLLWLGYRVFDRSGFGKKLLFILPPLAVVVNNLPILALASGAARVTGTPWEIFFFAMQSLMIGIFEEAAFRGVLLLVLLEKRRSSTKEIFWTTALSAAVFGGVHLLNLAAGAGFGPTIMQVGYSFLIGGMCGIVLLKTRNLWLCALLHAIFDFCGFLVPQLGEGTLWDTPTVVFTAVLAVLVTTYMVFALLKIKPGDVSPIYEKETL